jgi:hypothetical protein
MEGYRMKNLLTEEMKRAIQIIESKEEITKTKIEKTQWGEYEVRDRETSELKHLLLMIRKHSILLEKEINDENTII